MAFQLNPLPEVSPASVLIQFPKHKKDMNMLGMELTHPVINKHITIS